MLFLDNTVLSNFALADAAKLIMALWPEQVGTTQAVMDEYQFAEQHDLLPTGRWDDLPVFAVTEEEQKLAETFSRRLGRGERTCIAVARKRKGIFASDDADARAAATKLGLPVTGTVGILLQAVRRSVISLPQANELLETMIAAGYRSPVDRLDSLL
jgi:predicted nucleic acid-binding protein